MVIVLLAVDCLCLAEFNLFHGGLLDPFRLCLGMGPLGVYLLAIGLLNLSRKPWVTTGFRDSLALTIGITGLLIVGPLELLMPAALATRGWLAWIVWLGLYSALALLTLLLQSPRLVIYNLSWESFQPILAQLLDDTDSDARWSGDVLYLPRIGVQLKLDVSPSVRNISLVAVGDRQSLRGWGELQTRLTAALSHVEMPLNPSGVTLSLLGGLVLLVVSIRWFSDPQAVISGFVELLRL